MRGVNPGDTALLQGQLWTPDALRNAGMTAWYDASAIGTITSASSAVSSFTDRFAGGTAVQATGAAKPTLAPIGNNPGRLTELSCDGGDNLAPTPQPAAGTGGLFTAVCVGERTSNAANRSFFGRTNSGGPQLVWDTAHTLSLVNNFSAVLVTSAATASLGYHIAGGQSGPSFSAVTIDGVETSNTTSPGYTQPIETICYSNAQGYIGGLGEIILFNTKLSLADRQRLEGYCAWKWDGGAAGRLVGLLPASHPYKNMPPLVGGALRMRRPQVYVAAAGGFFSRYYYDQRAA